MSESKTSISGASSYAEIGEFWDTHDLSDYWEQTKPAEFEVELKGSSIYFRCAGILSNSSARRQPLRVFRLRRS